MSVAIRTENGTVKYCKEWEEWVVTFSDGATYHTDDKADALATLARNNR